jgi:hypothetical protein
MALAQASTDTAHAEGHSTNLVGQAGASARAPARMQDGKVRLTLRYRYRLTSCCEIVQETKEVEERGTAVGRVEMRMRQGGMGWTTRSGEVAR